MTHYTIIYKQWNVSRKEFKVHQVNAEFFITLDRFTIRRGRMSVKKVVANWYFPFKIHIPRFLSDRRESFRQRASVILTYNYYAKRLSRLKWNWSSYLQQIDKRKKTAGSMAKRRIGHVGYYLTVDGIDRCEILNGLGCPDPLRNWLGGGKVCFIMRAIFPFDFHISWSKNVTRNRSPHPFSVPPPFCWAFVLRQTSGRRIGDRRDIRNTAACLIELNFARIFDTMALMIESHSVKPVPQLRRLS